MIGFRDADLTCTACASLPPDQTCPAMCELRFVISGWSTSFKHAHAAGIISSDDWADVMHDQIRKLLVRPCVRTMVGFEKKDPTFLYGFICGDTTENPWRARLGIPTVFYVYVKGTYRRRGFARDLFTALGVDPAAAFVAACKTQTSSRIASKTPLARWDPLVARYPDPPPEERNDRRR